LKPIVLVDTGPLVALLNRRETHHDWARQQFSLLEPPLLTCESVLSEACFLLRELPAGPDALLQLVSRGVINTRFDFSSEATTVARLMKRYANVPMSLADACLVRMAELHAESSVLTLDSHFRIYRKNGRQVIPALLPL
jgi:predicted nucleic acid-binding protein